MDEAFIRNIVAHPDDDAPRLVYADWLDETEDPANADRAEFIRLQIRLETLATDDDEHPILLKREKVLLNKYAKKWAQSFRKILSWWWFRRGFIEGAAVRTEGMNDTFVLLFRDLTEQTPLREVSLFQQTSDVACLLPAAPLMTRLRSFRLRGAVFLDEAGPTLRELFESQHLSGLTCIEIQGGRNGSFFGPRVLSALLRSPTLKNLTDLSVSDYITTLHPTVLRTLARSESLAKLTRLSVESTTFDRATIREILRADYAPNLTTLELRLCGFSKDAWDELLSPKTLPKLNRLLVGGSYIDRVSISAKEDEGKQLRAQVRERFGTNVVDIKQEFATPLSYHSW